MEELVFSPKVLEGSPEESFVLKFPQLTVSLMFSKGKIFAELLEGDNRSTFEGEVKDSSKEFKEVVNKVMENLESVVHIDHK